MNKKILIGSIIAVAIIILSSFSSVVGKVSSDNELVEFDVEFCGLGEKHTVKLTQQEADKVELLFDDIKEQLENVETREEAEEIFKETVVELDKYGLLGGLGIRQTQNFVTGNYQDKVRRETSLLKGYNNLCLFISHGEVGFPLSLRDAFIILIYSYLEFQFHPPNLDKIMELYINYKNVKLFRINVHMLDFQPFWLYTFGLQGGKNAEGGTFRVYGYYGMRIWLGEYEQAFYLGWTFSIYQM